MGAKESQALAQLMGLLESRYAMRVLWALQDGKARTFRMLQTQVSGITPNTLNTRIKELREAALLTHDGEGYCATPLGMELARRFADMQPFALKWSSTLARKAAKVPAA